MATGTTNRCKVILVQARGVVDQCHTARVQPLATRGMSATQAGVLARSVFEPLKSPWLDETWS